MDINKLNEELDFLLSAGQESSQEFDWSTTLEDYEDYDNGDYYDYPDPYDPYEEYYLQEIEEYNRMEEFKDTYMGLSYEEYLDQCWEMYVLYGIQSQYNDTVRVKKWNDEGCYLDEEKDSQYDSILRVSKIHQAIDKGMMYNVGLDAIIAFCEQCLLPEERWDAIKYFSNLNK